MTPRFVTAALILSFAGAAAAFAAASPDPRLGAVAHRQAEMKKMGGALKAVAGYAQGTSDDVGQLRQAAAAARDVAAGLPRLFPAGTGQGVGTSRAKPNIWSERDAFNRRILGLRSASAALALAAVAGNRDEVKPKFRAVGAACKSCHDFFQVPH